MGAHISHRPGKCLKHRRAKSEEHLSSKQQHNFKSSMGKLFNPWNNILTVAATNRQTDDNGRHNNNRIVCDGIGNPYHLNNNNNSEYYRQWMDGEMSLMTIQKTLNGGQTIKKSVSLKKSHSIDRDEIDTTVKHFAGDEFFKLYDSSLEKILPEITKDSIFDVKLNKGSRGLGFSIMEYEGLILIKQLFPLETASQCGLLKERDIILSANGNSLSGLSSFEALRILRTLENPVHLIMCRLQQLTLAEQHSEESSQIENNTKLINNNYVEFNNSYEKHREFEVSINKIAGSLGFTLRKEGNGECSHLVRALVKEPAISDGRIKPGDKIISVNDVDIGMMSHQEAVKFLRDCDAQVRLRLRRDVSSSSLASLASSSQSEANTKTLRKEALEMLNDLAVKKSSRKFQKDEDQKEEERVVELRNKEKNITANLRKRNSSIDNSAEDISSFYDDAAKPYAMENNLSLSNNLGELADEPVSLPALDVTKDKIEFRHNDPAYHSMNVTNLKSKDETDDVYLPNGNLNLANAVPVEKNLGLFKWKGIILDSDDNSERPEQHQTSTQIPNAHTVHQHEIITVELQRSWNSRLGFSLGRDGEFTVISRIHDDSVASKDGRLRSNDRLIQVNEKNVQNMETNQIIEMLRNVRGPVTIVVQRTSYQSSGT